jgi:chaperonin cofactor prefoldin
MSLKRRLVFNDLDDAKKVVEELIERVEALEKRLKIVYHTQSKTARAIGSSMHDVNTGLTDANRKITQVSKK